MTENQRKRLMYGVCILTILWGLYMQPWKSKNSSGPGPDNPNRIAVVTTSDAKPRIPVQVASLAGSTTGRQVNAIGGWGPNPFRSVYEDEFETNISDHMEVIPNAPVLNGMMKVGGVASCVLNGRVCKVGDQIKEWRVIAITPDGVLMQDPNQQPVALRMVPKAKKKGTNNE